MTCRNYTYCYSCSPSLYLYNNTCISTCPPTTYQLNIPGLACIDCINVFVNCLTCTQVQCTSCVYGKYLYNGICYDVCPLPLLPSIVGTCGTC